MYFKYFNKLFLLYVLSNSVIGFAQNEDTMIWNPVIITGEITRTTASQTVQNVRVINRKMIETQGAVNLADLLSKELNIRVGNDNILGSSMSLQGIGGQNIKILLDGVPLVGNEAGNIDLNQINLNNIERIEIIEGPLSVIYGTDALGGVINLISKKIELEKLYALNTNSYYESIGRYNFGFGGAIKLDKLNFFGNFNRNFSDGYSPDQSRVMLWKPKSQVFGNIGIQSDINSKLRFKFKTELYSEKIENRGTPVINHQEAYGFDEYFITNRSSTALELNYKQNRKTNWNIISAIGFYQRDKITYRKNLETLELDVIPTQEANSSNSFLSFMSRGFYNKELSKSFNYQLGYDINLNNAYGTRIISEKGKMNDYAIFSCFEYKPNRYFTIKPGVRISYNNRYQAPIIPSLQFQYSRLKNFTFKYSFGNGFRAPGLKELYLDFVDNNHNILGNENLKSEVSQNHNFSIVSKQKLSNNRNLILTNSYFFNKINNQIALVVVDQNTLSYTYKNIDKFRSWGTNLFAQIYFGKLFLSSGFSIAGIRNSAFDAIGQKNFLYTPEFNFQSSYSLKHKKLEPTTFSVFYKYNGKVRGFELNETREVVPTSISDFSSFDASVNQSFFEKKLRFTLGLKNILNITNVLTVGSATVHSAASSSMPISIGRSFFVQLNFNI